MNNQWPSDVHIVVLGQINDQLSTKLVPYIGAAVNGGVKTIHLCIQSSGGNIHEGIALYNLFTHLPVEIITYNIGAVSSIAVLLYLAGKKRKSSKYGTFMFHKAYSAPTAGINTQASHLSLMVQQLLKNDERIEGIIRSHAKFTEEQLAIHKYADLVISADEALIAGVIDEILDFNVPPGSQLTTITA